MSTKMSFKVAALCGVAALAITACGGPGGGTDGDGPIKVGIIADLTGATRGFSLSPTTSCRSCRMARVGER